MNQNARQPSVTIMELETDTCLPTSSTVSFIIGFVISILMTQCVHVEYVLNYKTLNSHPLSTLCVAKLAATALWRIFPRVESRHFQLKLGMTMITYAHNMSNDCTLYSGNRTLN